MKKNLLSTAVATAALVGASAANAVFVNPEGHGQVLLYPFYTVEGGHDTYINLTNTTGATKAVKVRFVESMNSKEVLDFNLYLSPYDHWSGVVSADPDGEGAVLKTADTSCTVPQRLAATDPSPSVTGDVVPFRNFEYDEAGETFDGLDRTREGYVEVIEMGVVSDSTVAALIKHGSSGVPADCGTVNARWQPGGDWDTDNQAAMGPPTGGLYGYGVLINVQEGTNATYDAVALDDFTTLSIHREPGSVQPSLADAQNYGQVLEAGAGASVVDFDTTNGIDAVSAVLMHSSISNDYVLEPSINAATDWVITFPTKRQYVDREEPAIAPFTQVWNAETGNACEVIGIEYWNREEAQEQPDELDFSPRPQDDPAFSLCREANVITFNNSEVLAPSERVRRNLEVIHDNGWAVIDFDTVSGRTIQATSAEDSSPVVFNGLPTIGFAVQKYVNGELDGGVLSNYAGVVVHKNQRSITSGT